MKMLPANLGDYGELTGSRRRMNIGDHSLIKMQG